MKKRIDPKIKKQGMIVKHLMLTFVAMFLTLAYTGGLSSFECYPSDSVIELVFDPSEISLTKTFDSETAATFSDIIDRIPFFNCFDWSQFSVQNRQIQTSYNRLNKQLLIYNKPIVFHQLRIPSLDSEDDPFILFYS